MTTSRQSHCDAHWTVRREHARNERFIRLVKAAQAKGEAPRGAEVDRWRGMSALAVSVRTAATMTEISETTIREAINKQQLPAFRVGRQIRIKVNDLEGWLDSLVRVGSEDDA